MKKTIKILLVDDEPMILRVTGGKLMKRGFEVLYAHDGNEGREMARRMNIDLILLDLRMPVMDGFKTLTELKAEKITKDIPVIILTGEDLSLDSKEILINELGAADYIHKSTPTDILVKSINKALKSHKDKSKEAKD